MAARAVPGSEVLTEAIKWLRANLSDAFGPDATFEAPLHGVMGCRLTNIDLRHPLTPAQAELLVEALPRFRVLCISGQVGLPSSFSRFRTSSPKDMHAPVPIDHVQASTRCHCTWPPHPHRDVNSAPLALPTTQCVLRVVDCQCLMYSHDGIRMHARRSLGQECVSSVCGDHIGTDQLLSTIGCESRSGWAITSAR
jgi:hypothetical protein